MGEYVELPGVKTWYEVEGDGDPVVLLHGGMVTNDTWGAQRSALAAKYRVFLPERRAHGHTPDVDGPLSYNDMAADTIDFLEKGRNQPGPPGGMERRRHRRAARVRRASRPRPETSGHRGELLTGHGAADGRRDRTHLRRQPGLGDVPRHVRGCVTGRTSHWADVVSKLVAMYRIEPNISLDDLGGITARTLVMTGDDDMIDLEHTTALYRAIPNSELAIVPGTSHALLMEKPELGNRVILDFLDNEPVATFMPLRRAAASG